jgi:hypothetical protein
VAARCCGHDGVHEAEQGRRAVVLPHAAEVDGGASSWSASWDASAFRLDLARERGTDWPGRDAVDRDPVVRPRVVASMACRRLRAAHKRSPVHGLTVRDVLCRWRSRCLRPTAQGVLATFVATSARGQGGSGTRGEPAGAELATQLRPRVTAGQVSRMPRSHAASVPSPLRWPEGQTDDAVCKPQVGVRRAQGVRRLPQGGPLIARGTSGVRGRQ